MQEVLFAEDRVALRKWFEVNFQTKKEIWIIFPYKSALKESISYNDAVEEALCFGWIDSIMKSYDHESTIQRYSVRNPRSTYSQLNKERIVWLNERGLIHPSVMDSIGYILEEKYVFPCDIIEEVKSDPNTWTNFNTFSDSYKRIRIAYIEAARSRPAEFRKRLDHFIRKTKSNTLIKARGTEKYY